MNELEQIKSQLNDINNKRVRCQTLIEQARKECEEILVKYNVSSIEELKSLVDKTNNEYQQQLSSAKQYIEDTNKVLSQYQGII